MNIFKTPGKAFQAAIHNPVVQTVFPVFAVSNLLTSAAASKALNSVTSQSHAEAGASSNYAIQPGQGLYNSMPPQFVNYQTSPSGSYLQSDYGSQPSFEGGSPWGYSMESPTYFQPQPTAYSPVSPGGGIWEDIVLGAGALFL